MTGYLSGVHRAGIGLRQKKGLDHDRLLRRGVMLEKVQLLETPEGAGDLMSISVAMDALEGPKGALVAFSEAKRIRKRTGSLETSDGAPLSRLLTDL